MCKKFTCPEENELGARGVACRESVQVRKRVLIRGRGELGETKVDHRGNCPAFRINNASVLLNLDIDMTGYREALRFDGADPAGALVHKCIVRCEHMVTHEMTHYLGLLTSLMSPYGEEVRMITKESCRIAAPTSTTPIPV